MGKQRKLEKVCIANIRARNIEQFNTCFDAEGYKEFIDNDVKLANSQGFFDTPNFISNQ